MSNGETYPTLFIARHSNVDGYSNWIALTFSAQVGIARLDRDDIEAVNAVYNLNRANLFKLLDRHPDLLNALR